MTNKAVPIFRSLFLFSIILVQTACSDALLTPANAEEIEAKKKKMVETTEHTISTDALNDEGEDGYNREDEEFFEENEEAGSEGGPKDKANA